MPFMKHIIEPINVSQCPLPPGEPNELECLSNLTLANVIRQLSSLGQHAGRIFDELTQDALKINTRAQVLNQRIENLKLKCSQLDIQNEEVSLSDFQNKKQYKASVKIDQQVVIRKTMPDAMKIMYNNADPPPALDKLNPYRTDGKDCMKFYTDPEFFFNIWCNELIKDNETRKIEKKRRRTKNENKQNVKSPSINQQHIELNIGIPHQLFSNNNNSNSNIQTKYDEAAAYYQQQIMLLNQTKSTTQQQLNLAGIGPLPSLNIPPNQFYSYQQHQQQSQSYFINDYDDQTLPPPPPTQQLLQTTTANNSASITPGLNLNYEIYAESNKLNNGNRNNRITTIQQASLTNSNSNSNNNKQSNNERPVLPPPPIPSNQISDLQQIQQQMIRKKLTDINIANNNNKLTSNNNNNFNSNPITNSTLNSNNNSNNHYNYFNHHNHLSHGHHLTNCDDLRQSNNDVDSNNADLPPPPSPPSVLGSIGYNHNNNNVKLNNNDINGNPVLNSHLVNQQNLVTITTAQMISKLNINEKTNIDSADSIGSAFDMPLPPPPIELETSEFLIHQQLNHVPIAPPSPQTTLHHHNINNSSNQQSNINNNNNNNNFLPPPPPLPPLVESDTASSSSSLSINNSQQSKINHNSSNTDESKVPRNCYLDDITKRRYQLRSTQKDTNSITDERTTKENDNGRDTLQPFVNNSDVAAIIDFIRKFRPHVRDSSDDDEENSDWDD